MENAMNQNFVQIDGLDLMYQGEKVFMQGVTLGNWLILEDHMSGIPYVEHKARERFSAVLGQAAGQAFFDTYQETYITEKDIAYIKELGVNLLRVPFNYRLLEDGMSPGVYKEEGFALLDRVIAWAKKYDLFVLLDLHAAPGCQAIDWNVDCAGPEALFWKEKDYQQRTIKLWQHIAARYKDETTVMGYELLGEPVATAPMEFDHRPVQEFYREIIPAVRSVDPNHIFLLVANLWGKATESLTDDLFEDPQTMAAPHHYPYETVPYSEVTEYPCEVVDREKLMKVIDERADQGRIKRPVLFGEFGIDYTTATEPIYQIVEDQVSIFKERGYHWCIWSYKDIAPFGFVNPADDSPWKKFIEREDLHAEHEKLNQLCRVNFDAGAPVQSVFFDSVREIFPQLDFEYTQHRVREARRNMELLLLDSFLLKMKELSAEEIQAMAESFSFDQCVINPRGEQMIKRMLGN
jgi:endoglucanase